MGAAARGLSLDTQKPGGYGGMDLWGSLTGLLFLRLLCGFHVTLILSLSKDVQFVALRLRSG